MHAERPLCPLAQFQRDNYLKRPDNASWTPSNPHEWAEALISYQMAPSQNENLLEQALAKWNPQLCTFMDPQQQDGGEPKVTLLDLIFGHYHHRYSQRALKENRAHLLAALVQPFEPNGPVFR